MIYLNRWSEISKKNLSTYTCEWNIMKQVYEEQKIASMNERISSLLFYLTRFWKKGERIVNIGFASKDFEELNQKLQYLNAMLLLTKNALDFGLTDEVTNSHILFVVLNVLSRFNKDEAKAKNEYWLAKFLNSINENDARRAKKLLYSIYDTAISIIHVYGELQLNIQIIKTLQELKSAYDKEQSFNTNTINFFYQDLFLKSSLNAIPEDKYSIIEQAEAFEDKESIKSASSLSLLIKQKKEPKMNAFQNFMLDNIQEIEVSQKMIPGSIYLLNTLFELADENKALEKKFAHAIRIFLIQRDTLLKELFKVELIIGPSEINILREFLPSAEQFLDPQTFDQEIDSILNDDIFIQQGLKIDIVTI